MNKEAPIPRWKWNESKPMYVIGTIDSYGAIRARFSSKNNSPTHTAEDGPGHRWRFNIWAQDFHPVLGKQLLTQEECVMVHNWLDGKGYIYHKPEDSD